MAVNRLKTIKKAGSTVFNGKEQKAIHRFSRLRRKGEKKSAKSA
jgi:hypothetical protein